MGIGAVCAELPLPPGAVARIETAWIADLAFSPDGSRLALLTRDAVEIRAGEDLKLLGSIPLGKRGLSLAFADRDHLIVGTSDGVLLYLDVPQCAVTGEIAAHSGRIWDVAVSPDGKNIAYASEGGVVAVYSLPSLDEVFSLRAHEGGAFSVAFSPEGKTLASGGKGGEVRLWGVPSGDPRGELRGHSAAVWDLEFSREGRLISAGSDGKCIVWDPGAGEAIRVISPGVQRIRRAAFRPGNGLIAMATSDVDVVLWDEGEEAIAGRVRGHTVSLWTLDFSPDGGLLASVSADGRLILWDMDGLLSLRPRITKVHYTREMGRHQIIGVSFEDPNADISMAEIQLLEGDRATVHITPSNRMQIHHYRGKTTGFFTFGIEVEREQTIRLRIVLIDILGLCSEARLLEIKADG